VNERRRRIVTSIVSGLLFLGVLALLYFRNHPDLLDKYQEISEEEINTKPVSHFTLEL
jgi:hypothetical protein